ncbi:MFS transporter [Micromonospora sp. ATCC 39149]|uniref:MFS transporter n=1 Tax=Micromonospora sp. (strain ATCC 39149 / NRRL 15099 / SCC 1413) TaxID=219305 RepID=UPI002101D03C|nr:MFS transporter [Micromonospora sp. ATCC 39149]
MLAPILTPRLVNRYGNSRVIFGGFLLAIVAYGLFLPVGMDWSYAAIFPGLLLSGIAVALAYGPLTIAATDSVAKQEQGLAGGLLYTFTQFGSAVGISAVTAVYGIAVAGSDGSPGGAGRLPHRARRPGGHGAAGSGSPRLRPAQCQARRPTEGRGTRDPLRGQRRRSGVRPTTTAAPSPSRIPYQPPLPYRPLVSLTGNAAPRLLMAR